MRRRWARAGSTARYLKSYQDIGFTGYHCIEREAGENRVEETREAIAFVRRTWQQLN